MGTWWQMCSGADEYSRSNKIINTLCITLEQEKYVVRVFSAYFLMHRMQRYLGQRAKAQLWMGLNMGMIKEMRSRFPSSIFSRIEYDSRHISNKVCNNGLRIKA